MHVTSSESKPGHGSRRCESQLSQPGVCRPVFAVDGRHGELSRMLKKTRRGGRHCFDVVERKRLRCRRLGGSTFAPRARTAEYSDGRAFLTARARKPARRGRPAAHRGPAASRERIDPIHVWPAVQSPSAKYLPAASKSQSRLRGHKSHPICRTQPSLHWADDPGRR
jgi:hypothetical protein